MTSEKFIKKVYKELNSKLGMYNYIVQARSMWKWYIDCEKKALTISQPNDQVTRFADYKIICLRCETTQLIKSNQYSKKLELDFFISDLKTQFNFEIST